MTGCTNEAETGAGSIIKLYRITETTDSNGNKLGKSQKITIKTNDSDAGTTLDYQSTPNTGPYPFVAIN